mmetsp:Transcript_146122/g.468690  ORF Transcript_146122/g.468690 Transcript_146122/m.468690 type:complete len:210 (-) Transcript_146122:4193-4822(-)
MSPTASTAPSVQPRSQNMTAASTNTTKRTARMTYTARAMLERNKTTARNAMVMENTAHKKVLLTNWVSVSARTQSSLVWKPIPRPSDASCWLNSFMKSSHRLTHFRANSAGVREGKLVKNLARTHATRGSMLSLKPMWLLQSLPCELTKSASKPWMRSPGETGKLVPPSVSKKTLKSSKKHSAFLTDNSSRSSSSICRQSLCNAICAEG